MSALSHAHVLLPIGPHNITCRVATGIDLVQATRVAGAAFHQPVTGALQVDVEQHLTASHFGFSFCLPNGQLVGFTLFKKLDEILCGGGTVIQPEYQGQGLFKHALRAAHAMTGARFVAYRTQSCLAWSVGRKLTTNWHPRPDEAQDSELEHVAQKAAAFLNCSPGVTPGFYGGALYGEKPIHPDPVRQAWWDRLCNFERGDCVLCVGRF